MKSKSKIIARAIPCAALALHINAAGAATIASWDNSGQDGLQASTPGVGSLNVTADAMVRGPGVDPNLGANSLNSTSWGEPATANPADDEDYVQFGFDIAPGYSVFLDQLIIGTRSSNTGPGTVGVFTSADGFAAPVFSLVQPGTVFVYSIIDLSGIGTVSGAFDVRLIEIGNTQADGSGDTASGGTFRVVDYFDGVNTFSDTQITGRTVRSSVPDGGTTAFLGLLAFGGLGLVRKFMR